jgi:putative Mg2+ transporter-C (MgtC) family protein
MMRDMATNLAWSDIAVRLLCTALAGALIGFNRGEHGRPAGLRTTMLVSLAARLSMIQANLLLPTAGKPPTSFVVLDLMRLPLGILSGMGFIGAGAILRRDNFVVGVTTAATLWFVTVIGLCFGGGQILLGLVGLAAGLIVLAGLKQVEERMKQDRQGTLSIVIDRSGPGEDEIRTGIVTAGFKIMSCAAAYNSEAGSQQLNCELRWRAAAHESNVPEVVRVLAGRPGVNSIAWTPQVK